jgi:hypothetical protein
MEMMAVSSSTIARVGYDAASQTLRIEFHSGSAYEYFDVPEQVFANLINPPEGTSTGKYFSSDVKGQFRYSRL